MNSPKTEFANVQSPLSITGYTLAQSFAILIFTTFVLTSDFWSEVQVIVNSRFLQHQHKQSRWNLLIHRRLTKTKSIGRRLRCIESDGYGLWSSDSKGGREKSMDKDRISKEQFHLFVKGM